MSAYDIEDRGFGFYTFGVPLTYTYTNIWWNK